VYSTDCCAHTLSRKDGVDKSKGSSALRETDDGQSMMQAGVSWLVGLFVVAWSMWETARYIRLADYLDTDRLWSKTADFMYISSQVADML
jgi:hypothetical protein